MNGLFFLRLLVVVIMCQVCVSGQKSDAAAAPQTTTQAATSSDSSEVQALKAQLETMRFYDQRLMYTVYWSLGTVAAIAVLLSGFSWYANFRMYERDRGALQKELENSVRAEFAKINLKLQAETKKIDEAIPTITHSVGKQFASELKDLKKSLNSDTKNVEGRWNDRLYHFQLDVYEFLAAYHEEKQHVHLAFRNAQKVLAAALNWQSEYAAMNAIESMKRLIKKGKKVSVLEFAEIAQMVERLPEQYREEREPFLNILRSARE